MLPVCQQSIHRAKFSVPLSGWCTSQSITLPAACLTANVRFRFQAKGQNVWRLLDPGWYVDTVTIH
jgi:hypothetical protein